MYELKSILKVVLLLFVAGFIFSGCVHKTKNIWEAATKGDVAALEKMINEGVSANAKDDDGETPLHLAAKYGHADAVRFLLAHGARINARSCHQYNGATPLHLAAELDQKEIVPILISAGADVNVKDDYGNTPLHYAATSAYGWAIPILLSNGANINAKNQYGDTPLVRALRFESPEPERMFIQYIKSKQKEVKQ